MALNLPAHIINLAAAIVRGQLVEDELHDALEEIGLSATAEHFKSDYHDAGGGTCCAIASWIARGKDDCMESHLNSHHHGHHHMAVAKELWERSQHNDRLEAQITGNVNQR